MQSQEHTRPWYEAEEDGSVRVNLYVFWSATCPHCHRALRFLDALEGQLPWLDVRALELSEPENAERYAALAEQLGTEASYVPAFFYCGRSFQGYQDDDTTGRFLRESHEACHVELLARREAEARVAGDQAAAMEPPIDVPLLGPLDPPLYPSPCSLWSSPGWTPSTLVPSSSCCFCLA